MIAGARKGGSIDPLCAVRIVHGMHVHRNLACEAPTQSVNLSLHAGQTHRSERHRERRERLPFVGDRIIDGELVYRIVVGSHSESAGNIDFTVEHGQAHMRGPFGHRSQILPRRGLRIEQLKQRRIGAPHLLAARDINLSVQRDATDLRAGRRHLRGNRPSSLIVGRAQRRSHANSGQHRDDTGEFRHGPSCRCHDVFPPLVHLTAPQGSVRSPACRLWEWSTR